MQLLRYQRIEDKSHRWHTTCFSDWKRSYTGFRSSITINPFFLRMKNKSETRTLAFPPDPRTDSPRTPRSAGLSSPGTSKNQLSRGPMSDADQGAVRDLSHFIDGQRAAGA